MDALENLVRQAQQGDCDAYEHIVRRFQDMAVGYSYALLGDWALAQDAAQEAFIRAFYDLKTLREPAAFPGWFRQMVFKQSDRAARVRRPVVSLEVVGDIAVEQRDPAQVIEQRETLRTLDTAIESLADKQREVILLFYMGDYSLTEISAFLEIPVGTVKTRLHHARKYLKERLLTMPQDQLTIQRPSRDNQFTQKVMHFFKAAASGDLTLVNDWLAREPELIRAVGAAGTPLWDADASALQIAVMHGQKAVVDALLAKGADINEADDKYHFTPLHQALDLSFMPEYAALNMPDFLISRGAHKDVFALMWMDDYEGAKTLIKEKSSLVNSIGPGGMTPICYVHTVEMAQFLLDHGADIRRQLEGHGVDTAIRFCAYHWLHYHGDVLRLLLQHGQIEQDIFLSMVLGEDISPLLDENPALVQARTKTDHVLDPNMTLLHLAAQIGTVELVRDLIDRGADVNARDDNGMTPLHRAVRHGMRETVEPMPSMAEVLQGKRVIRLLPDIPRLLLERGADLKARDTLRNQTPLEWAEMQHEDETDRTDVIRLMRQL